ncbi:hypothetical protein ACWD25_59575 [Streptomyces sp. NPDC002920]
MNGHTVLYDPEGRIDAQLPLDRVTHERVIRAVLAWSDPAALCGRSRNSALALIL